jgi:hypothetical protein
MIPVAMPSLSVSGFNALITFLILSLIAWNILIFIEQEETPPAFAKGVLQYDFTNIYSLKTMVTVFITI